MPSSLHKFLLFLHKSLWLITGLFRSFFGLFTGAGRATESDAPGIRSQSYFTSIISSRRPNRLKSLVLPQNITLRRLEDAKRTTVSEEMASSHFVSPYPESANSSDPELGRCNVVDLREYPLLSRPLSIHLQSPMPSISPSLSDAGVLKPRESVSRSSSLLDCDNRRHLDKNSLPRDADLPISLSSASLKVWTSSPQGKHSRSPARSNCSYSQLAGENRFASPFGDRGSSYFAPYFNGVRSVTSATDLFDFSVYASSPHANVECPYDGDGIKPQETPRLATKMSTAIDDPAIQEVFTLRHSYGTRTPGRRGRSFDRFPSSTPPSSPISPTFEWSPSGLFSTLGRQPSSSSCSTTHTKSLSDSCIISLRDLSAVAEIEGIHSSSAPRDSVRSAKLPAKSLIPDTVSCPTLSGAISCTTTVESQINMT